MAPFPEVFNDLQHFLMVLTHVVPVSVEQVSNHSHNNPFHPVYDDSPIVEVRLCNVGGLGHAWQVLELLAHRGVHRVPVLDRATGRITKLITQSAITKWLAHVCAALRHSPPHPLQNPSSLDVLHADSVSETKLGLCDVLTVSSDAPAIRALELLVKSKLSGVRTVPTMPISLTLSRLAWWTAPA